MELLKDKAALVTGGSRGIGRAIVMGLAAAGADVAFTYRQDTEKAQEVMDRLRGIGRRALSFRADVADFAKAQQVVEQVISAWGRLDILVNNAGIHQNEAIWAMTETQWDEVLDVNLKGTFNYSRAVAPVFRQQRAGKIVNIASIHGLRGRQAGPNYSAAKAGVIGLTKSVARDLGPYGVNVNAVAPGITETDMVRALSHELKDRFVAEIVLGRMGQPEDVAHLVTFLCSDQARHIAGEVIKVDGGQYI
ncbi:MAG: SDR family oxidoreductase [Anaerolineae bacterium]|nr:SDR family oxidoreductase [Anaerolineae bacterium]